MVKMAVFSAWAELQIASAEQTYLVDVLKPHIAKLTPLWLASLREYARLRFEPDISSSMGSASLSGSLDTIYAALNRETLLKVSTHTILRDYLLTNSSSIKNPGLTLLMLLPVLSMRIASLSLMLWTARRSFQNLLPKVRLITSITVMSLSPSSSYYLVLLSKHWRADRVIYKPPRSKYWRFCRHSRRFCDLPCLDMPSTETLSSPKPWICLTAWC